MTSIPGPAEIDVDWVFAYGSLIWDPGDMAITRIEPGRIPGLPPAFCIRSTLYRGTPERPGLVLGLDRGGSCMGMAQHLDPDRRRESLEHLYAREIPVGADRVYLPRIPGPAHERRRRASACFRGGSQPAFLRTVVRGRDPRADRRLPRPQGA